MTSKRLGIIAMLGSIALLGGAFAFQHIGGLAPCNLCFTQRWPHAAAIVIGLVSLIAPFAIWYILGAVSTFATAVVGAYHVGVEQKWWQGPQTCSGGADTSGKSAEELLEQLLATPVVRCDEIAWQLAGISMAGWNMLLSLILCAIWLTAFKKTRTT